MSLSFNHERTLPVTFLHPRFPVLPRVPLLPVQCQSDVTTNVLKYLNDFSDLTFEF